MKIAIYGSKRQDACLDKISAMLGRLGKEGIEVVMHRKLYNYLLHCIPLALAPVSRVVDDDEFTADFALSIGGDGTFLRTAMWVGAKEIPILGVNTGHLGYLAGIGIDNADCIPGIFSHTDEYVVSARSLIEVDHPCIKGHRYALNEVAVTKEESASMIVAHTRIDGDNLASYRADGLIIATPTGSTAYNLSVGGPILQPDVPVWVISPIAAHSLSMRPLVVSSDSVIEVCVEARAASFRLTIDGRSSIIPVGETVKISRAPFCTRVMLLPDHTFTATLRNKLMWGAEG